MTIYLDIVFFENVLMNFIIIYATGVVVKCIIKKRKVIIASCIGALYTVLMYMDIIPIYSNVIMKIILSFALIYVAFTPKSLKQLLKYMLIFYLVTFVFGGCVFALMYFLEPQMVQLKNGVFVGAYPLKIAVIGGIIAFIVVQISFKVVKFKLSKKDMIYNIEVSINGLSVNIKALLDTGNLLKDPITGFPVIVIERNKLYSVIPEQILNNIDKIIGGETDELIQNEEFLNYISKFRMIPFSSLGKQNGLLLGIKADSIKIILDERKENVSNVIIGIYDKSFTKNGMYSGILGLEILEGGDYNEHITNVKV